MEFNKIAGAVLFTALSAMVISKIGDLLVPEEHFAVHGTQEATTTPTPKKPEKKDPPVGQALAQADPKKGEALTKSKCSSCHTWNKGGANKVGPNLYGVVGNDKGTHPGYSYSSGMKSAGGKWTYEDLYNYLPNPGAMVKGTKMTFRLPKWKQRADVIAFLRTQDDNPEPMPKVEPASKPEPDKTEGDKKPEPGKAPEPKKDEAKKTAPDKPATPEKKSEPEKKPAPEKKSEAPMKKEEPKAAPTGTEKKTDPAPETKPAEKTEPKPAPEKKTE